ncbi:MAG: ammonia-forming cytochrome c nitrite reductase subunit c552 [Polyangiaceae bacterium]
MLNVNRACQTCHRFSEEEIKSRVDVIQERNYELLQRGGKAITDLIDAIVAAKQKGATPEQLKPALELQRKAQWRLDFIAAENSMGFHAPQEAARVLGEAADYARQGQLAAITLLPPNPEGGADATTSPAAASASAGPQSPAPQAPNAEKSATDRAKPATPPAPPAASVKP